MSVAFRKAVKYKAKSRVALIGPAGSGKSFTALQLARTLVGPTGKIAAVDTEHGSLSKYADLFDFDVLELDSFSPESFKTAHQAAVQAGYDALLFDSLSHFWVGKDGALEFVDNATKRNGRGDSFAGWKDFRPHEREMVDLMIASPLHIICTMRTKTAYEEQTNERTGKKQRVKIGLAPVQREGLEYEFDLVGLMDDDNTMIVDKTRCSAYAGKALTKPKPGDFAAFREWLDGEENPSPLAASAVPNPPAASANGAAAPRSPQPAKLDGNRLSIQVKEVLEKKTKPGAKGTRDYLFAVFEMPVNKINGAFCWHNGLFDAVRKSAGKYCQFEIEESQGRWSINEILDIGGHEYRDGKPYIENPDADPVLQPNAQGVFISDDDIPF